jgi:hypothetical protein
MTQEFETAEVIGQRVELFSHLSKIAMQAANNYGIWNQVASVIETRKGAWSTDLTLKNDVGPKNLTTQRDVNLSRSCHRRSVPGSRFMVLQVRDHSLRFSLSFYSLMNNRRVRDFVIERIQISNPNDVFHFHTPQTTFPI